MKKDSKQTAVSELESLAVRLDAMAAEADKLDERVAKRIGLAAKSARFCDKQVAVRRKKVGSMVAQMKEAGMSDAEIVAKLSQ